MANQSSTTRSIVAGSVIAVALLIAAIWTSDASVPTSLALTAVILLGAVLAMATIVPVTRPPDDADDQRDRMRQTTP